MNDVQRWLAEQDEIATREIMARRRACARLADAGVSVVLLAGGTVGFVVGPDREEALRSVGVALWTLPLFLGAALYHGSRVLAVRARGVL